MVAIELFFDHIQGLGCAFGNAIFEHRHGDQGHLGLSLQSSPVAGDFDGSSALLFPTLKKQSLSPTVPSEATLPDSVNSCPATHPSNTQKSGCL